jgi:hypothetical protein
MKRTLLITISLLSLTYPTRLRAELRVPDNLIYGSIVLDGQPVTSLNTNVVVEARRSLTGPAIASYRMGSEAEAGDLLYVLRLALESTPVLESSNSEVGATLFLVVRDSINSKVVREIRTFRIAEWGQAVRIDFGSSPDADGDGIPDNWESLHGGGPPSSDDDSDGLTKLSEYIAGTNPNDTSSVFKVDVSRDPIAEALLVSFFARSAERTGYEGRSRLYSLEAATSISGPWITLSNYDSMLGQNQSVLLVQPLTNGSAFYRGRVWLQGP